jgi:hypothetical protein
MWKDILQKNAISIACGVVAIIALIASIVPADSWVEQLQDNLDARKSVNGKLETLNNKPRSLPGVVPGETTAPPLKVFPSDTVIAAGAAATEKVKLVSRKLYDAAIQLNFHPLLVPNSLPKPRDPQKYEFRGAYAQAMKYTRDGQIIDANIPIAILNGAQPPTPAEIANEQTKLWDDKYTLKIVTVNGTPANYEQTVNDWTAEATRLPDLLREQTAKQHKIYIMPGALTENTAVAGGGLPNENDIWAAQLGLWIQQDIARAIAATNANSKEGILDAPVKQLIQLNVPVAQSGSATGGLPGVGGMRYARAGAGGNFTGAPGEDGAAGTGTVSDPAAVLTTDYTNSPTGRVSQGLYDVHDFALTVDVEAAQLPHLLNELTRGRYMAIHSVNLEPVNVNQIIAGGFMYGAKPVVRVVLHGEILYLRKWTEAYMPDAIKAALGIVNAPQGVGQ